MHTPAGHKQRIIAGGAASYTDNCFFVNLLKKIKSDSIEVPNVFFKIFPKL
jgi:hypothetical protein